MSQAGIVTAKGQPGTLDTLTGNMGGPVSPDGSNNINILGTGGAYVTGIPASHTLLISVTTTGFTWQTVTSASPPNPIQLVAQNGYICGGVSQVTFILPLVPNIGDSFIIISSTSTFKITENGAQQMRIGTQISTAGSGTVVSNSAGDTIEMIYVGGNTFLALSPQGTLTTS